MLEGKVTRRGVKKEEMLGVVELIKRTILDGEKPENIRKDVADLCAEFQKVEYCYKT